MNKLKHFDRTIKELLTIFKSVTMFYTGLYKGQFTIDLREYHNLVIVCLCALL